MRLRLIIFNSIFFAFTLQVKGQLALQKADSSFAHKEYFTAIEMYQKAFKKQLEPTAKNEISYKISFCYAAINKYKDAKNWVERAIGNGYTEPDAYLLYGNMLFSLAEYSAAKTVFLIYQKRTTDNSVQKKIASCDFALSGEKSETVYEIKNLSEINSNYSEFGLSMINDKLIFGSSRLDEKSKYDSYSGQGFSDLYETTFNSVKNQWGTPFKLKGGVNTKYNDGTFAWDAKNNLGYFMQCNGVSGKKQNCNIYYSKYNAKQNIWGKAEDFYFSDPHISNGHPAITSDGNTLYFVSDMLGGIGGKDIWVIKRTEGIWGQPKNLGPAINTAGNEMFPSLAGDSLLFFSTSEHIGYGGLDIFYVILKNGKIISNPINMLAPINSAGDDFAVVLTGNTPLEGYFCSNREGGKGDDDIYSFRKAALVLSATGMVVDAETKKPVSKVKVSFKGSDGTIGEVITGSNGEFNYADLKPNLKYIVSIAKQGFFSDAKDFVTRDVKEAKEFSSKTGTDLNFKIVEITKKEICIPNINYDFNESDLKYEAKNELNKLARMLKETPNVVVEINSYTDEKGDEAYNLQLSIKRAQCAVNYLSTKGVDKNRMIAKGYGASQPLTKNAKTAEAHQLNRRTTFKVIKK